MPEVLKLASISIPRSENSFSLSKSKLAVNKFNSRYENITEEEKKIIKNVLNGNDEEKEKTYSSLKNECIDIIDNRLSENADLDLKDKLLKVSSSNIMDLIVNIKS